MMPPNRLKIKVDYEEDVIDGFAIYSFFTYNDSIRVCHLSFYLLAITMRKHFKEMFAFKPRKEMSDT